MSIPHIFISYSHDDSAYERTLEVYLKPLRNAGKLSFFADNQIVAGAQLKEVILRELNRADIVIFLVSSNFLASDFIQDQEVPLAMRRYMEGKCCIFPVILRTCLWGEHPVSSFICYPKDAKPIATWDRQEEAWTDVMVGLLGALKQGGR